MYSCIHTNLRIVTGNSEGRGVSIAKIFKGKYEAKLEISGWWEGSNKTTILGGGIDIYGTTHTTFLG